MKLALVRGIGVLAGTICRWSTLAFVSILAISGDRPWLMPITLLLLPFGLPLLAVAFVSFPVALVAGTLIEVLERERKI